MLGEGLPAGTGCTVRSVPGTCSTAGVCEIITTTTTVSYTNFPSTGLVDLLYRNRAVQVLTVSSELELSGVAADYIISSAAVQQAVTSEIKGLIVSVTGSLLSAVDIVLLPAQNQVGGVESAAFFQYGVVQRFPDPADQAAVDGVLAAPHHLFNTFKASGVFDALSAVVVRSCDVSIIDPPTRETTTTTQVNTTTTVPYAAPSAAETTASASATALAVIAGLILFVVIVGAFVYAKKHGFVTLQFGMPSFSSQEGGITLLTQTTYDIPSSPQAYPSGRKAKRGGNATEPEATASDFMVARAPVNVPKNRSQDHLPYDHNRVELLSLPGAAQSTYINASLVTMSSATGARDYIASQAPLDSTALDFWRMVVEQKSTVVVMLGNSTARGDPLFQYFPLSVGATNSLTIGEITITLQKEDAEAGFLIRKLEIDVYGARFSAAIDTQGCHRIPRMFA
jgi:hypothetical protein